MKKGQVLNLGLLLFIIEKKKITPEQKTEHFGTHITSEARRKHKKKKKKFFFSVENTIVHEKVVYIYRLFVWGASGKTSFFEFRMKTISGFLDLIHR